jgi:DAK2 domain fusion protein YloV
MPPSTTSPLTGSALRNALVAAAAFLRESAAAIDAINVYPVPDGDTGTNMASTLADGMRAALRLEGDPGARKVLDAVARGALYGARGNSGVILSQALRGLAAAAWTRQVIDARAFADGLSEAAREAYAAVAQPVEGTMLTVLRRAAEAAVQAAAALPQGGEGLGCREVLLAATGAAEAAEAETTSQLPVLREAGLPDAGGQGICAILQGLLAAIDGAAPSPPRLPVAATMPAAGDEEHWGYCTEFLVERTNTALDIEGIRRLAASGDSRSVVVVGDEAAVHVHVHTKNPEPLLAAAEGHGRLVRRKVEDMDAQHARWHVTGRGARSLALLALSRGEGFDAVFRGLGADVADLGDVVKAAAGEIAAAADATGAPEVIVLPNHTNVRLAARQAVALARAVLHVVPSETLPQGVAAAVAFDEDEEAAPNVKAMTEALARVRTVEVARATADRRVNGVSVRQGDSIALIDGELVAAAPGAIEALLAGLARARVEGASLVTLYGGSELGGEALAQARAAVAAAFPGVDIESLSGGQPLYPLIASVED